MLRRSSHEHACWHSKIRLKFRRSNNHRRRPIRAFVANEPETGERSFIFYRKPWVRGTSDSALSIEDVDFDYIAGAKILHVSGFALSQNPSRKAVLAAVQHARKAGVKVSFDPTLRVDVWNSEQTLRRLYSQMLKLSNIVTFSREEASFMFRIDDPKKNAQTALRHGIDIVGIKLGADGALVMTKKNEKIFVPAFKVKATDTTGAGDGWNAGLLVGLLKNWDLKTCVTVANAVGALVVTKRGAITALPYRDELNSFLMKKSFHLKI
jgi:sugar/nucleoside kinase (ribokinase family)